MPGWNRGDGIEQGSTIVRGVQSILLMDLVAR